MKRLININSLLISTVLLACVLLLPMRMSHAGAAFGEDTVNLRLGAFLSDFDTGIALTGPDGVGREINLEDALGLDADQTTFRGELMWRFAPRHRVILGYYSFDRSATASTTRDIIWEFPDKTIEFTLGTDVSSKFDWQLVPLSYSYSFYKTDKTELSAQLGIHWFDMEIEVAGEAIVDGAGGPTFITDKATASGPLPVIGLRADHALTPKWLLGLHLQYFGLDYDEYSGELVDARIHAEYLVTDNFNVGLGYTWYDIGITERKSSGFSIHADHTYDGVEAYIGFRF